MEDLDAPIPASTTRGRPKRATCAEFLERVFSRVKRSSNADVDSLGQNRAVVIFEEFETKTGGRLDALDVTDEVRDVVDASNVQHGTVLVFSPHTTCCVLLASPGSEMTAAFERAMRNIAPDDGYYAHDDLDIRTENLIENEPANAPAHIVHAFLGKASEAIPIDSGQLMLGTGQRVLFVELDSSRKRRYCIQVIGE
jgi:secondary thiamine-phosphate synthase enzyme